MGEFLDVPGDLTGRGVRIAIVDGTFTGHPDICVGLIYSPGELDFPTVDASLSLRSVAGCSRWSSE